MSLQKRKLPGADSFIIIILQLFATFIFVRLTNLVHGVKMFENAVDGTA